MKPPDPKSFFMNLTDEATEIAECANHNVTTEEMMDIFEATRPKHDATYRELAKGPEGLGPHDPRPFDLKKW